MTNSIAWMPITSLSKTETEFMTPEEINKKKGVPRFMSTTRFSWTFLNPRQLFHPNAEAGVSFAVKYTSTCCISLPRKGNLINHFQTAYPKNYMIIKINKQNMLHVHCLQISVCWIKMEQWQPPPDQMNHSRIKTRFRMGFVFSQS